MPHLTKTKGKASKKQNAKHSNMNFSTIAFATLLLGLSGIAAEPNAAEQVALCEAHCSAIECANPFTGEPNALCAACDFCQNPSFCENYCMPAMCGYSFICRDCDFCQTAPGQKCESMCNQVHTFVDGEWKYQFPPAYNCVATPEECGGCPVCQQCDSWCSPVMCGYGYCENCEFCKVPFEPTPTCLPFCSVRTCADSEDFCSGCNWCKTPPKICDSHCSERYCRDAACEDCEFCPPSAADQCNMACSIRSCNFGSEGTLRPCTGCPFCKEIVQ